jgi:hypothetical protein
MAMTASMEAQPRRWNDDRLDEFARNVDKRFDQVDKRFDKVDKRFDKVDERFDKVDLQIGRVNDRVDRLQHSLVMGFLAMGTMMFAGFGAIITLFVTHF